MNYYIMNQVDMTLQKCLTRGLVSFALRLVKRLVKRWNFTIKSYSEPFEEV